MKSIFELITSDTLLLTPNRRLAASLLNQFNQVKISEKKSCWKSPDILPLTSWLQRLWKEYSAKTLANLPFLLTTNQKTILWEMIVRQSPASDHLLQIGATAESAETADELLKLWEVSLNDPILDLTEDSRIFQQWARQFQKLCKKNNWLDIHTLIPIIKENLLIKNIIPPKQIILFGFTEISPQHENLLKICEELGSKIIHHHANITAKSMQKIGLLNEETEIRTMARWAKATYETSPNKKPFLIGCIVPRLESLRETVLHIFSETFSENNTFTLDHTLLPFNISAGKSLTAFPVIHAAFELLKLSEKELSLNNFCYLLQSPFIGEAEQEKLQRSLFENRLKKANILTLSLDSLLQEKNKLRLSTHCPLLAKRLKNYLAYFSALNKNFNLSAWVKHFMELLKLLGWPGERSTNSQEYQAIQRWLELLEQYSAFDTILPSQNFSQALEWLYQLSTKTVFQPESPETPIQILGLLEATELPFEHLWIMGMDDSNWPASPKPNPLLPLQLQKKCHMPHATTARELTYSKKLLQQITHSTKYITFSYAEKNEDIHLRPSTLLNDIKTINSEEIVLSEFISPAQLIFNERKIEEWRDEVAPPVQETENILGGTKILQLQAACPFKAFAEIRLHATAIDSPVIGLRPIDRGNIIHKILEFIWKEIKDSETLKSLSHEKLNQLIQKNSLHALQEYTVEKTSKKRYLQLELNRLNKLMTDWLTLENQRPAFKVAFTEHEIDATIGNIPIHIRIDRIDQLDDQSYLIIDYKTGKHNEIKKWFTDRPDEPQLPLYCVITEKNITGIAFAQIHPDDMTLKGASKKNIDIKSIKTLPEISYASYPEWNEQTKEWKIILENLASRFMKGDAKVDPKDRDQTCMQCKLPTFCRIYEK